jgi:hypothetical protein
MPLQATSGAASYDAFGGGVPVVPTYIEDVFSCFLYTGTGNSVTQRIASGIDLATKGGMVWVKNRTEVTDHQIYDTARGQRKYIRSNTTDAEFDSGANQVQYKTSGWDAFEYTNELNKVMASWTFRKQPKFFDVVTYTGDGVTGRTVAHGLGSVPGFIIVKPFSTSGPWAVAARKSDGDYAYGASTYAFGLNSNEQATSRSVSGLATDTTFTPAAVADVGTCNNNGVTYVAYLFAHNAGGFGLTGTDNVISCGSYTEGASATTVTLGYEPQWILLKRSSGSSSWYLHDTMRGMSQTNLAYLQANSSAAESDFGAGYIKPTATGFIAEPGYFGSGSTVIYIAIRRGPMKVPTSGTSVFSPTLVTGNGTNDRQITGVGFPPDLLIGKTMGTALQPLWYDKLRGKGKWVESSNTLAEQTLGGGSEGLMLQDGFVVDNNWGSLNINTRTYVNWMFRRAPSFFDEVCYTGTGSDTTQTHNLTVAPELVIIKSRSNAIVWVVGNTAIGFGNYLLLNTTDATASGSNVFNNTAPTSTVFSIGAGTGTNQSGATYVAYLFATLAGVSKVGSYTGTATTKQIDCGFTGGARFVLIKRTDSTGDWYVWDSARGIVAGNDPYLLLNSTAAEVTNTDYVDTYSAGFEISSTAPAAINASGGTFIFLAIA